MLSPSGRSNLDITVFGAAGLAVGLLAWTGHIYTLPVLLLIPVMLRLASTGYRFWAFVIAYHAGATWTLLPGSSVFFGHAFRPLDSLTLWLGAIAALVLPWALMRLRPMTELYWSLPLSLAVAALLPTGIENPLTVAGILFPRFAWIGLLLTLAVFGGLALRPFDTLKFALPLIAIAHIAGQGTPAAPKAWVGIDTTFGGSGFLQSPDFMISYRDAMAIQDAALTSRSTVTVFPETVVKSWNSATDLFWTPTYKNLATQGRSLLVGAEVEGDTPGVYSNVLLLRGAETAEFRQRVPIPIAMWHPFAHDGVSMNLSGPSTMLVNGTRIAPLICYEQLLTFPVLTAVADSPALLVGVANDYWARNTYIPDIQAESLDSWSRLFWIPTITAVNR